VAESEQAMAIDVVWLAFAVESANGDDEKRATNDSDGSNATEVASEIDVDAVVAGANGFPQLLVVHFGEKVMYCYFERCPPTRNPSLTGEDYSFSLVLLFRYPRVDHWSPELSGGRRWHHFDDVDVHDRAADVIQVASVDDPE
jgi:hypothetical protein